MKKVLILYKYLPQWRVDFFNLLRDLLAQNNIELNLVYGKLKGDGAKKNDEVDLNWGLFLPNKIIKLGRFELYWQPAIKQIFKSDLIIVEQANKLLINYLLILLRIITNKKLAFWGHGVNLQDKPNSFGNRFKKLYSQQCDWWFAYTAKVKERVIKNGFPNDKITIVQNAIDTNSLSKKYSELSAGDIQRTKEIYKIGKGPVALFCGGMYNEKRLNFLLESCFLIKNNIPGFEMIFLGAGPEDYKITEASKNHSWIHSLGAKFNEDKVPFFKMADILLMPGLVGLAILDSFAMQTPIITTDYPFHSPEIEYLEDGVNGIMTKNDVVSFSQNIVQLLKDNSKLKLLNIGCIKSAKKYTLENMVDNFADGIIKVLKN